MAKINELATITSQVVLTHHGMGGDCPHYLLSRDPFGEQTLARCSPRLSPCAIGIRRQSSSCALFSALVVFESCKLGDQGGRTRPLRQC
jgi:hypothetical protein